MGTIKTAISIDSKIFDKVDRLSRKLHISRSQFFTQAAIHMIKRDDNLELLQKINDAYEKEDDKIKSTMKKKYSKKKIIEKW
jgi:metal-responsive CopG/Arc/MetJ family transcriptional regulator